MIKFCTISNYPTNITNVSILYPGIAKALLTERVVLNDVFF